MLKGNLLKDRDHMKNYLISACLCITFLLSSPAYCLDGEIPANECPSVSAIIVAGIDAVEFDPKYPTIWTAMNAGDHYGTQNTWSLEVEFISAKTQAEAIAKGNAALKFLTFSGTDMFFCIYDGEYDNEEITARAMKVA